MDRRPFVLSAKVVIVDAQGRVLLLRRSMNSKNNRGKWDLPGGKVDAGEAFDEALIREVREETGLEVSLDRVAGAAESQLPGRTVAYIILEGRLAGGQVRLSDEHTEFTWAQKARLGEMDLSPQFKAFAAQYAGIDPRGGA